MNDSGNLHIGIFGIGLETYWEQFADLKGRLSEYQNGVANNIDGENIEIFNAGIVDTYEKAQATARIFKQNEVELIFLYITTYALSSTVLTVIQHLKTPVVLLNLQPVPQLDYNKFNALDDRGKMTELWLEHCQACCVPEISNAFNRAGIDFYLVSGFLQDRSAWNEIDEWIQAIKVVKAMKSNRMGLLGHYYSGMLDVYSDMTQLTSVFGTHFELLEICELHNLRESVTQDQIDIKIKEYEKSFEISSDCKKEELFRSAKTSVALDHIVEAHDLGSLAYYYEGIPGNNYEDIVTSVIAGNTLLTGKHVPVAGEYEIKNAHAMKIMDILGRGGSFSEIYLADYICDHVLLGHDGPAHFAIAEGHVGLVPLPIYHGKPGSGLSIQMTVKHGPVTLLSIVQSRDGTLSFLVAEGESVPGPVLDIGNTNSRYKFSLGAKGFIDSWSKAGPAHHCAIGTGHFSNILEKTAMLLGIKYLKIC